MRRVGDRKLLPRVSVIIPTNSRPRLVVRAVESARRAAKDVEIVVVDDASTDETAIVCRNLEGVTYVRLDRNQGVAGARNVGLLASTCEFVAFLDDDDRRLPGSLDSQIALLDAHPQAAFACGAVFYADQSGELTGVTASPPEVSGEEGFWRLLELDFFILPTAVLIRRDYLLRAGLARTELSRIDDWDLFVRLAELFPVVVDQKPVGIYTLPPLFSASGVAYHAPDFLRVARRQRRLLELPRAADAPARRRREARRRTLNRLADVLFYQAATRFDEGGFAFVFAYVLAGLRLSPRRIVRPTLYKELWRALRSRRVARQHVATRARSFGAHVEALEASERSRAKL